MPVEFSCDLKGKQEPLSHFWEHTVGSGHALLGLRADWQEQLRRCHDELGFHYVRFHGLLSDDVGTFVIEENQPLYSFFNIDRIFDFLLSIGMKPFVELSFMPSGLSSGSETVFHYRGNVTPPKDFKNWGRLVRKLVEHWINRYGAEEVRQWFFEVWNEPNLKAFWTGTRKDYFKLYRDSARAIKEIDAELRVGGPATAQNEWLKEFVDFCERNDLPADFISTHYYPTDAFGKKDTDTTSQLADAPHGVMRQRAKETVEHANGRPIYYTEWSISSNPRDHFHDEPFAAALATNIIMNLDGLVDGFSYWTFTDIFEENYFPSKPFHGGFGLLNLYGIPKPVARAFELLHKMGSHQLQTIGNHRTVSAWVGSEDHKLTVLMTNHAMPRHPIKTELVHFRLDNAPRPLTAYVERVDEENANPRREWQEMGEPEYLSPIQVERLESASCLTKRVQPLSHGHKEIDLEIALPAHSVAAITVELQNR